MPDQDMLFIRLAEFFAERRDPPAGQPEAEAKPPPPRPQPPAAEER